jgi:hypothetical protein
VFSITLLARQLAPVLELVLASDLALALDPALELDLLCRRSWIEVKLVTLTITA